MSNPLRLMRKYQKRLMVFFGVLLMLAFIVGGSLMQWTGGSRSTVERNPAVARWVGGTVKRYDLNYLKEQHRLAQAFLQLLVQEAMLANQDSAAQFVPNVNVRLMDVADDPDQGDRDMMLIMMLAKKAEQTGMVVGTSAVMEYLSQACDRELSEDEMSARVLEMTNSRQRLSQIVDQLKTELLAMQMRDVMASTYFPGFAPIVTPAQAYAFDARQFRTSRIQVVPYLVEDYLDQVSDKPSEREIRKLYDEGWFRYEDPYGKRPGFRQPRKLHVAWIEPDLIALRPAPEAIPAEEIQARYDIWKEDKASPAWTIESATGGGVENGGGENAEGQDAAPMNNPPLDNSSGDLNLDPPSKAGDAKDATDDGASTDDGTNTDDKGNAADKGNGGDDGSNNDQVNRSAFPGSVEQFVSLEQDSQDDATQDDQGSQADSNQDAKSNDTQDGAQGGDQTETKAGDATTDQNATAQETANQDQPPVQPGNQPPAGANTSNPDTNPALATQEPRLLTLDEVRDQIVSQLQTEKANERAWEVITQLTQDYLNPANEDFLMWEAQSEEGDKVDEPNRPDIETFVTRNGFRYFSTKDVDTDDRKEDGLVSFTTFEQTDLAKEQIIDINYFRMYQSFPTLGQLLAANFESLVPYDRRMEPETAQETAPIDPTNPDSGTKPGAPPKFIYWLVEKQEPSTPPLDECREDVVRFWKLDAARDLARADADKLIQWANEQRKPFVQKTDVASRVLETPRPFPWMSSGGGNLAMGGGPLQISDVAVRAAIEGSNARSSKIVNDEGNLRGAGNDFMSDVFQLKQDEAGLTSNSRRDVFFAVYVVETGGLSYDLLKNQVVRRRTVDQYDLEISGFESRRLLEFRIRELEDEMKLAWLPIEETR